MSNVDGEIKTGDVAHDLVKGGTVQVVDRAALSVAEYRDREDFDLATYQTHPLLDVSDHESVWTCVYLPSEPSVEFSGTYDFPESRLARIPVEEANQSVVRPQRGLAVALLEGLFSTVEGCRSTDEAEWLREVAVAHGVVDGDIVDEAWELAQAERTIGGDGDE